MTENAHTDHPMRHFDRTCPACVEWQENERCTCPRSCIVTGRCNCGCAKCRQENAQNGLAEALDHIKALAAFAYEQGFHELGYDPVNVLETALRAREAQQAKPVAWNIWWDNEKWLLTSHAEDYECAKSRGWKIIELGPIAAPSEGAQRDAERYRLAFVVTLAQCFKSGWFDGDEKQRVREFLESQPLPDGVTVQQVIDSALSRRPA